MNELQECEKNLIQYAEKLGLKVDDKMLNQFSKYYELLVEWNEKFNLTAITDKKEVYQKHFMDSFSSVGLIQHNSTLCDIGTGAGFPGIVLKIVRPDLTVVLVDSLNKRVCFLNEVIKALNLDGIITIHNRAEDVELKNKYLNSFDYVVARAVAKLNTLSEYCLPYVKIGGKLLAYKSNNITDEIKEAQNAIKTLGGKFNSNFEYQLDDVKLNIAIIDKVENTSNKYPRNQNKPRTNPL